MQDRYADTAYANGYQFTAGSGYPLPEYTFVAPPEIAFEKLTVAFALRALIVALPAMVPWKLKDFTSN